MTTTAGIGNTYLASTSTTLTAAAQTEGKLFRLVDFFSSLLGLTSPEFDNIWLGS